MKINNKVNSHVKNTEEQIENTLEILFGLGLAKLIKSPKLELNNKHSILTWDNHVSSRFNAGDSFTSINQYIHIFETGAYNCILFDGSIIRASFKFERNILKQENLLFWPSPISIPDDELYEFGIRDALLANLAAAGIDNNMNMRSPLRLDFDSSKNETDHPLTHIHIQHSECRLSVNQPCCFNTFIKIIFKNFYPNKKEANLLQELDILHYSGFEKHQNPTITIK